MVIVIDVILLLRCELARFPNYIFAYSKYHGQQFENKVRRDHATFTALNIVFSALRISSVTVKTFVSLNQFVDIEKLTASTSKVHEKIIDIL